MLQTSSVKAGIRVLGLKTTSTFKDPPRGSKQTKPDGEIERTFEDCSLGEEGVKAI